MMHFNRRPLLTAHLFLICLSNVLVQYPFTLLGLKTTWGAFSYPLIFVLTDVTTRFSGPASAWRIVYGAMWLGLPLSYMLSCLLTYGRVWIFNPLALRIAMASLSAYMVGQLCDIAIFQRLRKSATWWLAPGLGNALGCVVDTYFFFFIAFFHGSDLYLSQHWPEIATVDLGVKLIVSLLSVLPMYRFAVVYMERHRYRNATTT